MLNKKEKDLLRGLIDSETWFLLKRLADEYCLSLKGSSVVKETQWDTIREVLLQDGRASGVKTLMQQIFNQAE